LRLKDGDQGLPAEAGRAGKHSSESKEAELDFANKAYTLAKRAQEQARERKEKQKAREDIDSRIRCNQAQHAVCAPLRLCVCDFVRARIVCLCVCLRVSVWPCFHSHRAVEQHNALEHACAEERLKA
jgi:hypothetical protein